MRTCRRINGRIDWGSDAFTGKKLHGQRQAKEEGGKGLLAMGMIYLLYDRDLQMINFLELPTFAAMDSCKLVRCSTMCF